MIERIEVVRGGQLASEEEVAAVMAAVTLVLSPESEIVQETLAGTTGWNDAVRLMPQRVSPDRYPVRAAWGRVERLRRAGRGGSGITGL